MSTSERRWLGLASWLVIIGLLVLWLAPRAHAQSTQSLPCNAAQIYSAATNGSTKLISTKLNTSVYICGYTLWSGGTASVKFIYGTGTTCATGATDVTPAFALIAQTGVTDSSPYFKGLFVPDGNDVCINTSAGVAVQAIIYYVQR